MLDGTALQAVVGLVGVEYLFGQRIQVRRNLAGGLVTVTNRRLIAQTFYQPVGGQYLEKRRCDFGAQAVLGQYSVKRRSGFQHAYSLIRGTLQDFCDGRLNARDK